MRQEETPWYKAGLDTLDTNCRPPSRVTRHFMTQVASTTCIIGKSAYAHNDLTFKAVFLSLRADISLWVLASWTDDIRERSWNISWKKTKNSHEKQPHSLHKTQMIQYNNNLTRIWWTSIVSVFCPAEGSPLKHRCWWLSLGSLNGSHFRLWSWLPLKSLSQQPQSSRTRYFTWSIAQDKQHCTSNSFSFSFSKSDISWASLASSDNPSSLKYDKNKDSKKKKTQKFNKNETLVN